MVNPIWLLALWGGITMLLLAQMFVPNAFGEIITIQLSKTCTQPLKYNMSSTCPSYEELLQFDNTNKAMSGDFKVIDGLFQREKSNYKNHCLFYHPQVLPLMIVVDPDGCWDRNLGVKSIKIESISPEDMLYKLTADPATATQLREMQRDVDELFEDKRTSEARVESLEDSIEAKERQIDRIEEQIEDFDSDTPYFKRSNANRQLKAANDNLRDLRDDLKEEEAKFESLKTNSDIERKKFDSLKANTGSRLVINGTTNLGVGRFVEECRHATIGADMELVRDTINFLLSECEATDFESRKTEFISPTPINIMDHKWYQYTKWLREAVERCIIRC